jgi:hypothetical protein
MKKIISGILQAPMFALILGSLIGAIWAAYSGIQGVTWVTPVILAGIIISFGIGRYLWS